MSNWPEWTSPDGSIRLINADCLEVLPTLAAGSIDAVITDPQYGISVTNGNFTRINNKGTRRFDFFAGDNNHEAVLDAAMLALEMAIQAATNRSTFYVWCGHRQFGAIVELLESGGFTTRFVVWSKRCPAPAPPRSGWPAGAEICVYGYKAGRTWNPSPGEPPLSNVMVYDSYRHGVPGKVNHPTQKPLGLMLELVSYSTKPGEMIVDFFAGSFTTGVAVARLGGRKFIGIEKEPEHFHTGIDRIQKELNRAPLFDLPMPTLTQTGLFAE